MTALTNKPTTQVSARSVQGTKQDFVIVYPSAAHQDLTEAVYALYYLPQNYKLVVLSDGAERAEMMRLTGDEALMDRVSFEREAGVPEQVSSVSFADVILRNSDESFGSSVQRQINLAESDSPEALASAILKAARV